MAARTIICTGPILLLLSCGSPEFVCGRSQDGDVARCDRPGEICVCSEARCAEPAPGCRSKYKFVSSDDGETECVPPADVSRPVIYEFSEGSEALCHQKKATRCGVPGGRNCPPGEICACEFNTCAVPDVLACEPGWFWVPWMSDEQSGTPPRLGMCFDPAAAEQPLLPGVEPTIEEIQLCSSATDTMGDTDTDTGGGQP